jgi:micrococcal nuclease
MKNLTFLYGDFIDGEYTFSYMKKLIWGIGIAIIIIIAAIVRTTLLVHIVSQSSPHQENSGESFHPNAWKFAELVSNSTLYPVDHVIDGDTLVANVLGHDITVRLIGMDTPETVDPRKPVECFGPEASAEAKRIFGAGISGLASAGNAVRSAVPAEIYVEKDPAAGNYDIYGRLLAYIYPPQGSTEDDGSPFPAGLSYNEYMVQKGFAREYTYMEEPYKYQSQFKADQKSAKAAGIGVWNKSVCPKPFSY